MAEYIARHTLIVGTGQRVHRGALVPILPSDEVDRLLKIRAIERLPGEGTPPLPLADNPLPGKEPQPLSPADPLAVEDSLEEDASTANEYRKATPEEMSRFARLSKTRMIELAEENEIYDLNMEDTKNDMVVRLIEAGVQPK